MEISINGTLLWPPIACGKQILRYKSEGKNFGLRKLIDRIQLLHISIHFPYNGCGKGYKYTVKPNFIHREILRKHIESTNFVKADYFPIWYYSVFDTKS